MASFLRSLYLFWFLAFACILFFLYSLFSKKVTECKYPFLGVHKNGNYISIIETKFQGCIATGFDEDVQFQWIYLGSKPVSLTWSIPEQNFKETLQLLPGTTNRGVSAQNSILSFQGEIQTNQGVEGIFLKQKEGKQTQWLWKVIIVMGILSFLIYYCHPKTKLSFIFLGFAISSFYLIVWKQNTIQLVGDEPHYLLMAESIGFDFDLDLKNQYDQNTKSLLYRSYDPHILTKDTKVLSLHPPLLGLTLSPLFFSKGLLRWIEPSVACKIFILLIVSFTLAAWIQTKIPKLRTGYFLWILLFFLGTLPYLPYSSQLYPETIMSLLTLWLGSAFLDGKKFARPTIFFVSILFILAHVKFIILSLLLLLHLCYDIYVTKGKRNPLKSGEFYFYLLIYSMCLMFVYFFFFPHGLPYSSRDISMDKLFIRYYEYWFGKNLGLLYLNPLYLFSVVGLYSFGKDYLIRCLFLVSFLCFGHLPNLFHTEYLLGACPTGRYWIAILPILAYLSWLGIEFLYKKNARFTFGMIFVLGTFAFYNTKNYWESPENFYIQNITKEKSKIKITE